MRRAMLAAFAFALAAQPCLAATKGSYVSLHHEQRDGNRASGISFTAYNRGMALGISANKITSNRALELQQQNTIYPVYAFAKLAMRTPIAPYVEFGVDLGDYLFNEISKESSSNSQSDQSSKVADVDAYGAIGIKTSMRHAPIDFAVYLKSYALFFNDPYRNPAADQRSDGAIITMSGANVIFNF